MIDFMQTAPLFKKFTVNTSGPLHVGCTTVADSPLSEAVNNLSTFQAGDIVNLISVVLIYPQSFVPYRLNNGISLSFEFRTVAGVLIAPLKPNAFYIPFSNYEINVNALQTLNIPQNYKIRAVLGGVATEVSMVGVPTVLNGADFELSVFAKIEHTLPLV